MLLSKTGSKIKHYLAFRREDGHETPTNKIPAESTLFNRLVGTRSFNFLPSASDSRLKKTISSLQIPTRGTHELPKSSRSTPYSSASSLCSCCEAPMSRSSSSDPNSPLSPKTPDFNILCLKSDDGQLSGDAQTWLKIFATDSTTILDTDEESTSGIPLPVLPLSNLGCTFDIFEALQLKPLDGDLTPKQSSQRTSMSSSDVSPIIDETVVSDLTPKLALCTHNASAIDSREWSPGDDVGPIKQAVTFSPKKKLSQLSSAYVAPTSSISKRRKQKTKRQSLRNHGSTNSPTTSAHGPVLLTTIYSKRRSNTRWNFSDVTGNVAELFRFSHLEADEMLTPERLLQKKVHLQARKARDRVDSLKTTSNRDSVASFATLSSEGALTPIEPFHLEGLAPSIDAAGAVSQTLSPGPRRIENRRPFSFEYASPPDSMHVLDSPTSMDSDQLPPSPSIYSPFLKLEQSSDDLIVSGLSFPVPPPPMISSSPSTLPQNPAVLRVRSSLPRRATSDLPTIDEVSPVTPSTNPPLRISPRNKPRPALYRQSVSQKSASTISPMSPESLQEKRSPQVRSSIAVSRGKKQTVRLRSVIDTEFRSRIAAGLCSTPYTLTAPLFRHGSVRLVRELADLEYRSRAPSTSSSDSEEFQAWYSPNTRRRPKSTVKANRKGKVDEEVDWTAFQMAISGGTGDFLHGGFHDKQELLEEVDMLELGSWWDNMGLEKGALVNELSAKQKSAELAQGPRLMDNTRFESDKEDHRQMMYAVADGISGSRRVDAEKKWQQHKHTESGVLATLDFFDIPDEEEPEAAQPKNKWYRKSGIPTALRIGYAATPVREAFARRQKIYTSSPPSSPPRRNTMQASRQSTDWSHTSRNGQERTFWRQEEQEDGGSLMSGDGSGPDSPMIEYPVHGVDDEVIPMGFNLTHDIGDYLQWEANHIERFN